MAGIDQIETHKRAHVERIIDAVIGAIGKRGRSNRKILVKGTVSSRALVEEVLGIGANLGPITGVIIFYLVVIPHNRHRGACVSSLQVLIGFKERVAQAILFQSFHLGLENIRHACALAPEIIAFHNAVLVDVVAHENRHIQVRFLRNVLPRGEIAVVPRLAGSYGEGEIIHLCVGRGQSLKPTYWAHLAIHAEAIKILSGGLQPSHLRVHRVRQLALG